MVAEDRENVISNQRNFTRGDRVSVSVRLRQKKEDYNNKKKRNRHSGDFVLFASKSEGKSDDDDDDDDDEDLKNWSYITFPNEAERMDKTPDIILTEKDVPKKTPIKVVTREVPGLLPLRPLSTVVTNNSVPGPASVSNTANKRLSGDFTSFGRDSFRKIEGNRRKSEIYSSSSSSRVCSDEFEFKKRENGEGEDIFREEDEETVTDESVPILAKKKLPSPKSLVVGLGRRSVTQINLVSQKKNSYKSALCKSQENLVKASAMSDSLDKDKSTLKKGLLWQQRDKLFSRWKERYFILTTDYLHCFKRRTSRITEMGGFIFKIKCGDVEDVELLDKRGYLTICISLPRDGKVYLRKTEGIREWYNLLKDCVRDCRKRRKDGGALSKKQVTDSSSIENWLQARKKIGLQYSYSDSTPEINKVASSSPKPRSSEKKEEITLQELSDLYKNEEEEQRRLKRESLSVPDSFEGNLPFSSPKDAKKRGDNNGSNKKINRLSLMSDIELPDCCSQDLGIDLEKGIFLRKKYNLVSSPGDTESNDSGNNSMNTNGSVGSTGSSGSANHRGEERLETHFEDRSVEAFKNRENKQRRRSHHTPGLQITHV